MTKFVSILSLAFAISACQNKAEAPADTVAGGNDVAVAETGSATKVAGLDGQAFANTAAQSDAFEIAISKLALKQGQSGATKGAVSLTATRLR